MVFPVEKPTRTSDKIVLHAKNSSKKRDAWSRCFHRGSNAGVYYNDSAQPKRRLGNVDYSTMFENEEKRLENPCCCCSTKWKLAFGSSFVRSVCAFSMWFYTEKIQLQVCGLFRTRFVGCYTFHAIWSSCDVAVASPMRTRDHVRKQKRSFQNKQEYPYPHIQSNFSYS